MLNQKGKILISACLTGVRCRYDGGHCWDGLLMAALAGAELIPVCPEQLGGLSTPREPAQIVGGEGNDVLGGLGAVRTEAGNDLTHAFIDGARKTLAIAKREKIGMAILKSRSPSCGCGSIYDGSFTGCLRQGYGVTATLLRKAGIICRSPEEIEGTIAPDFS